MAAVPTGAFQTDDLFESMIDDYSRARFLQLLERH